MLKALASRVQTNSEDFRHQEKTGRVIITSYALSIITLSNYIWMKVKLRQLLKSSTETLLTMELTGQKSEALSEAQREMVQHTVLQTHTS